MAFNFWKQLKKRLRRTRKPLWTLGAGLISIVAGITFMVGQAQAVDRDDSSRQQVIEALSQADRIYSVSLSRSSLCSEEHFVLGRMDAASVLRILNQHPDWQAKLKNEAEIMFFEETGDLPEACSDNLFFSLDKLGFLSLFEGPPKQEKVLRTFFQLDVQFMESALPKEQREAIKNGIKVNGIDEINSILSSFSEFALEPDSARVMQQLR